MVKYLHQFVTCINRTFPLSREQQATIYHFVQIERQIDKQIDGYLIGINRWIENKKKKLQVDRNEDRQNDSKSNKTM